MKILLMTSLSDGEKIKRFDSFEDFVNADL